MTKTDDIRDDRPFALKHTHNRIFFCLNHGSVQIMAGLWVLGVVLAIWLATPWMLLAIPFGIVFQYANEYILHRFIYHQKPPLDNQQRFNALYASHYGHHDFPNNPTMWLGTSLWYAPKFAVITLALQAGILWLLGVEAWLGIAIASVLVGSVGTYLVYEWAHTTAHAQGEKNWLERYITEMHNHHHFHDHDSNYHVSPGGLVVDKIGGTAFSAEQRKAKMKAGRLRFIRTLGMRPDDPRLITARANLAQRFGISPTQQERAKS